MLKKATCPERGVCGAGTDGLRSLLSGAFSSFLGFWPVCCYTAAIDRDDNESDVSSEHIDVCLPCGVPIVGSHWMCQDDTGEAPSAFGFSWKGHLGFEKHVKSLT